MTVPVLDNPPEMLKSPPAEPETGRPKPDSVEHPSEKRGKEPDFFLEWKDLKIEIKVYGSDISEEEEEFQELYPRISEKLLSSSCIQEKKEERRNLGYRPGSRIGHTLTELLEQNQEVNSRKPELFVPEEDHPEKRLERRSDQEITSLKNLIVLPNGQKKCHVCGKIFTDNSRIKRHLLSHSGKKPYTCNLCGWGFYQKCNMDRHMASHTKEGEGEPCPHCNNWFTTKSVLSLHMRDAHNDRLLTKKEVEITMNRMRRQMEEAKKQAEREEQVKRMKDRAMQQQNQRQAQIELIKHRQQLFHQQQQAKQLSSTRASELFDVVYQSQEDLARQMNRMANLTCNICGKTFVKKTNLKHHMMLHNGEKPWKCEICEWRFVQKCNLKKHMESHETGAFACPTCDVKFSSKASCSTHQFRVHWDQVQDGLQQVPQEEDEDEIPAPQQPEKPASTVTPWWKKLEMKQPEKVEPTSNLQAALSMPKKKPLVMQPLTCAKCGKMFLTKEHLQKHMLIHSAGVKPYACPVCGCRFHLMHNMKRHIHTHEDQGDIERGTAEGLVKAAESTTSQAGSVTRPEQAGLLSKLGPTSLASVTVDKKGNMKCNICMLWFQSAANLGAHMEVHNKDKPHVCSICGWRFKQHQNLKRHMHTHTGIKPFSCDFCDKGYTDAYTLKIHISKAHPSVASSLPSLQINPRPKEGDDDGFNSMLVEMQRKEAAVSAYQAQFIKHSNDSSNQDNLEDNSDLDESLPLEPDINMFTPEEDMVLEDEEAEDGVTLIIAESSAVAGEKSKDPSAEEMQDLLEMEEDYEGLEEEEEDVEYEDHVEEGLGSDELDIVDNLEDDLQKLEEQVATEEARTTSRPETAAKDPSAVKCIDGPDQTDDHPSDVEYIGDHEDEFHDNNDEDDSLGFVIDSVCGSAELGALGGGEAVEESS